MSNISISCVSISNNTVDWSPVKAGTVPLGHARLAKRSILPRMPDSLAAQLPSADSLLDAPAAESVRRLCRAAIAAGDSAKGRLAAIGNDRTRAASDLRQAVMQLRHVCDAYGPVLEELRPAIVSRRAVALARRLTQGTAVSSGNTRTDAERWDELVAPLRTRLLVWRERHALDSIERPASFASTAADALDRSVERLNRRLTAHAHDATDDTRRAVSVAVYAVSSVLTPLESSSEQASLLLQTVREIAAMPAPHPDAVRVIAAAAASLSGAWRRRAALPVEIERKWLLSALPPHLLAMPFVTIAQGYLPGEELVERIRSISTADGVSWIRTVKLGRGISRIEVEEPATPAIGIALFALTEGRRVRKRRYTVPDGESRWEIDEFTDRALVVAELELPTAETAVSIPDWLAPWVVREVTGEKEFTNWQLAR